MLEQLIHTNSYPTTHEVLAQLKAQNKDIYIFGGIQGGHSLGSMVRDFCDDMELEVKGHIVNAAFKKTNTFKGKPVYSLEEWENKDIALIIGMADVKAKAAYLKNLGFKHLYFLNTFRDVSYIHTCTQGFKAFFLKNLHAFEETYHLLSDDLSKEVMIGYLQDRIYNNYATLTRTQDKKGFFSDVLALGDNEVMVDCGAYDGDTCLEFIKYVPNYKQIYALEPDSKLIGKLRENTKHLNCVVIPKGAAEKKEVIYFEESLSGTSRISATGVALECDSIDNILEQLRSEFLTGGGDRV